MGNHKAAEAVAYRIETARKNQGVTLTTLSDQTGIPYATLRRLIQNTPHLLDIDRVSRIADALDADFTELLTGVRS